MRKIFAVVLTVLMLASVLAAFPVSAIRIDNSTVAEAPSDFVITEFGAQMDAPGAGGTGVVADALHYMEVLNTSGKAVDMFSIAVARATDYLRAPKVMGDDVHFLATGDENWMSWRKHQFLSMIPISPNWIVDEQAYVDAGELNEGEITNSQNGLMLTNENAAQQLPDDQPAIIWFIGQETMTWLKGYRTLLGPQYNPVDIFLNAFYPTDSEADVAARAALKDYVYMVWAYDNEALPDPNDPTRKVATDTFKVDVPEVSTKFEIKSYVYALVSANWSLSSIAYDQGTRTWAKDVYAYIRYGAQLVDNYTGLANVANNSASYIPAQHDPFLFKARELFNDVDETKVAAYTDYFVAGLAESYRECALVDMGKGATPGVVTDWQWSYIDASKLPTDKTPDAARTEFVDQFSYNADDTLADGGRNEPVMEIKPPSRDDLIKKYFTVEEEEEEEEGLPTWALVLIIVGGVLVVGGGAFVAVFFLVIKPKKKAAAAAAMEATVEGDAPVEEAPAQEETNE